MPDSEGENVVAIVELSFAILQHLMSYGLEIKHHQHLDTHVGMPKLLRQLGEIKIAEDFERIDTFRQGRWYGSKGNGNIIKECIETIERIKEQIK